MGLVGVRRVCALRAQMSVLECWYDNRGALAWWLHRFRSKPCPRSAPSRRVHLDVKAAPFERGNWSWEPCQSGWSSGSSGFRVLGFEFLGVQVWKRWLDNWTSGTRLQTSLLAEPASFKSWQSNKTLKVYCMSWMCCMNRPGIRSNSGWADLSWAICLSARDPCSARIFFSISQVSSVFW